MSIPSGLFPAGFQWAALVVCAAVVLTAIYRAPWRALAENRAQHLLLGSVVALIVLWSIEAQVEPGVAFHFLAMTTMTLMFGWCLAVLGACMAILALTVEGGAHWLAFGLNLLLAGVIPASLSYLLARAAWRYLPRHLFVYIFISAFTAGGVVGVVTLCVQLGLLTAAGLEDFRRLVDVYLPVVPLYAFPEALLNGMLVTVFAVYRPHWLRTFDADSYLGR